METKLNILPFKATHPGVLIKDELDIRPDLNQRELAKELGVKASFLNEIIKGKRPITADLAIVLEKSLNISAKYWMKFQSQYEIDKAKIKSKNISRIKNIELWKIIKEYAPIKYFSKQGYLSDNLEKDIEKIKNIYSVKSVDDLVTNFAKSKVGFLRKSEKLKIDEKNMFAWKSLAHYEAKTQTVNTFNFENINQLCIELNKVFYRNTDTLNSVKTLLNDYGVKFVLIKKLEGTPIDGYSFWSENNPAIVLTLRHNRIDNFAFTLIHEIGHITLHLKNDKEKVFIDYSSSISNNDCEKEADFFAQSKLIREECWEEICYNSPLNDEKIIKIGNKYETNPAILLGRICFEMSYYAYKTEIEKKIN